MGKGRKVPTEEEVKAALATTTTMDREEKIKKSAAAIKTSKLTSIFYFFVSLVGTSIVFFMNDEQFLRKKLGKKSAALIPWRNPLYDRFSIIAICILAFFITAIVLERRALLRTCRTFWRTQRREGIIAYRDCWRNRRSISFQYLLLFASIAAAAVGWRTMIGITNCDSPLVVVLSGSMETAFYRGDLLFLTNYHFDPIIPGEIVVFKIPGKEIPIVHRCLQIHEFDNGAISYLTKGDNNNGHDRPLYAEGQLWLNRSHIIGRANFFVPYIGMITVKINEYPLLKMAVIVVMVVMMLYTREL